MKVVDISQTVTSLSKQNLITEVDCFPGIIWEAHKFPPQYLKHLKQCSFATVQLGLSGAPDVATVSLVVP